MPPAAKPASAIQPGQQPPAASSWLPAWLAGSGWLALAGELWLAGLATRGIWGVLAVKSGAALSPNQLFM